MATTSVPAPPLVQPPAAKPPAQQRIPPAPPPVRTPPSAVPPGIPDFSVTVIDVGTIDEATGAFTSTRTIPPGKRAAMLFDVRNIGTARSEPWNFIAHLPVYGGFFTSQTQPPLGPGDGIRFTIGFSDFIKPGEGQAVIRVDPTDSLKDASRDNNFATTTVIRGY